MEIFWEVKKKVEERKKEEVTILISKGFDSISVKRRGK